MADVRPAREQVATVNPTPGQAATVVMPTMADNPKEAASSNQETGATQSSARICRCCGEPIPNPGNPLSRNPNICASCSSLADGMEDTILLLP